MIHPVQLFRIAVLSVSLIAAWSVESARASEAGAPGLTLELSRKDRLQILSDVAGAIEQDYLDSARGRDIAAALRSPASRARVAYTSPMIFAREASSLLFEISGDRHVSLKWAPTVPVAAGAASGEPVDQGVRTVQFLSGNIGLLKLDGFHDSPAARESMVAALLVLRSSDALILDFRDNRGGASDAVRLLQSCFFAEPTLVMYYEDTPGERKPSFTERAPGTLDCRDKPLYILTSSRTASAAEDFIYTADLLDFGATIGGTTIGETTAGAAHFIEHKSIEPGFRLAVSVGRPVHPETGTNWEGVGIRPDIEVPEEDALERAHVEALTSLHRNASGRRKNQLAYHLHRARALYEPVHLSNGDLKAFVGRYGSARITLSTDGLLFEDPARAKSKLAPLSESVFQAEGRNAPQLIFMTDKNNSRVLELLYPDGNRETF